MSVRSRAASRAVPLAVVPFGCSDKRIHEEWTAERAKDLANFPSPFRMLLLGPPGGGKSTLIKNLVIHQRPRFDEVFIVHQDSATESQAVGTTEYDDLDATAIMSEVPGLDFWNAVCAQDDPKGRPVKRLVICDDLEMKGASKDRLKNLGILVRYASSHKGFSVCIAHQDFFGLPPLLKKVANVFVLWKSRARNEMAYIDDRCGLDKGTLKELFRTIATGPRDSLCIDHSFNTPAPLRLNIFQPIRLPEDGLQSVSSGSSSSVGARRALRQPREVEDEDCDCLDCLSASLSEMRRSM